jgi:hypothetical protein
MGCVRVDRGKVYPIDVAEAADQVAAGAVLVSSPHEIETVGGTATDKSVMTER